MTLSIMPLKTPASEGDRRQVGFEEARVAKLAIVATIKTVEGKRGSTSSTSLPTPSGVSILSSSVNNG